MNEGKMWKMLCRIFEAAAGLGVYYEIPVSKGWFLPTGRSI
jgi:hypothetical protein